MVILVPREYGVKHLIAPTSKPLRSNMDSAPLSILRSWKGINFAVVYDAGGIVHRSPVSTTEELVAMRMLLVRLAISTALVPSA